MSKSAGEFLRVQLLIDKGFHPLAYRLMCLQAHYRSELEFSWDNLAAAFTRLKRMVRTVEGAIGALQLTSVDELKSLSQEDLVARLEASSRQSFERFEAAICDDLNTADALVAFESALGIKGAAFVETVIACVLLMDSVLGLNLLTLTRADLRVRPKSAIISEAEIEIARAARKEARAAKDFAKSDAIRDDLIAKGVEVMDGDPLGWDWKIEV
jgi:cysteinyl-tRNA synthetase